METYTVTTVEFTVAVEPAAGVVEMTSPLGTVVPGGLGSVVLV